MRQLRPQPMQRAAMRIGRLEKFEANGVTGAEDDAFIGHGRNVTRTSASRQATVNRFTGRIGSVTIAGCAIFTA